MKDHAVQQLDKLIQMWRNKDWKAETRFSIECSGNSRRTEHEQNNFKIDYGYIWK
jgi:hypothetical protein